MTPRERQMREALEDVKQAYETVVSMGGSMATFKRHFPDAIKKCYAALAACPPDELAAPEPAQPLIEMACPDCGRTISTTNQAGEIWHGCTYCVTSWPCQHRAAHAPAAKERG